MNPIAAFLLLIIIAIEIMFFGIGFIHFIWCTLKPGEQNFISFGFSQLFESSEAEEVMASIASIVLFWLIHPFVACIEIGEWIQKRKKAKEAAKQAKMVVT